MIDVVALRALVEDAVRRVLAERPPASEYLSVVEAARVASVAPATIRSWVREGKLRRHGTPRVLRVRRNDLEKLMSAAPRAAIPESPEALAEKVSEGTKNRLTARYECCTFVSCPA
jgi:excisionase family DNA binding protein